jgi:hypothetical protein
MLIVGCSGAVHEQANENHHAEALLERHIHPQNGSIIPGRRCPPVVLGSTASLSLVCEREARRIAQPERGGA